MSIITVATCTLNQWALDFDNNLERVKESIRIAKAKGAAYRLGPELELCGYGCEDHFLEADTQLHCDESLADLLSTDLTDGILCDIGMPLIHQGVRYNCRVFCLDRRVLLVRPKMAMADDGNYRETRYFSCWPADRALEQHALAPCVAAVTGQATAPLGFALVEAFGTSFGGETCEELWTPEAPHIRMALAGCEIIGNGSGSHHQLRKLNTRVDLITSASSKAGGLYLYANQCGCDGSRLYFDGGALAVLNGQLLGQAPQFSVTDVEVVTATVDLDQVRSFRAATSSSQAQGAARGGLPRVSAPPSPAYASPGPLAALTPARPDGAAYHCPEEECALGPACWLWDYLRRSGAGGFFLPLSGGADSGAVACIVGTMCELVADQVEGEPAISLSHPYSLCSAPLPPSFSILSLPLPYSLSLLSLSPFSRSRARATRVALLGLKLPGLKNGIEVRLGDAAVRRDAERVCGPQVDVADPKAIAKAVLHSCYMGTAHSSQATRGRAEELAGQIGAYHSCLEIDAITSAVVSVFSTFVGGGRQPAFLSRGGTLAEDLALQNIQARVRMVMSYLCAQLLPWVRGRSTGFLLVLGSANVDEGLRGYMTKYDCSSADLNPIGSISKLDLKRLMKWAATKYGYKALLKIEEAAPTAELRPDSEAGAAQTDEEDMGMSYEELGWFGRLRKIERCGPLSMFKRLVREWSGRCSPTEVARKVKFFFRMYAINRHKMTTLTPSYHAENYSPCDNRFDLRQFLYPVSFPRQSRAIDALAAEFEAASSAPSAATPSM